MSHNIKKFQSKCKDNTKWYIIILLYLIQILIFQFMTHVTFPRIQANLGDLSIFDMTKGGYDVTKAADILNHLGEEGLNTYLHIQMPIDFIYPCIMAIVYYLILVKTSSFFCYSYYIFPALLLLLDWSENVCIILMLTGHKLTKTLVGISSFCTQAKAVVGDYILYFMALAGIIVYVSRWIWTMIQKHKKQV